MVSDNATLSSNQRTPNFPYRSNVAYRRLKRVVDIAVALPAAVITLPLTVVLCVIINLNSNGSPLFRQQRIGLGGKPFMLYKLRTMEKDAEINGPSLSVKTDPRVTSVGRLLRKYHLDEMPQFWNILKGDMSLVGPRPEREHYLRQLRIAEPESSNLHVMKPGITSAGMVNYGYASDIESMVERLHHDLQYLENASTSLDFKIMMKSIKTIFNGKGI